MTKKSRVFFLIIIFQISLGACASELRIEDLNSSSSKYLGKYVEVKGYLSDFPSLYLHDGKNKLAVYSEREMMTLFHNGYFNEGNCVKVIGIFKFSEIHKQYFIDEESLVIVK